MVNMAYIGLGSNLGHPRNQVLEACKALEKLPGTQVCARSKLYLTAPWGVLEQPPFVNAAVCLETNLSPHALLDELLAIEHAFGRIRDGTRWGPRTLDLDILHVPGVYLDEVQLCLPHPRIAERVFVLLPLYDLAPMLEIPGQGRVERLLVHHDASQCTVLP